MNGPITLVDISVLLGVLAIVAGFWYRLETRVSSAAKEALTKAQAVEAALQAYKLEVAENYAKNSFIRDVEHRLGERFDKIVDELHGLREDLQQAMLDMASSKPGGRRKSS